MPVTIHPIFIACIICGGCCSLLCACGSRHIEEYIHPRTSIYRDIIRIHPAPELQNMVRISQEPHEKYVLIVNPNTEYYIAMKK